VGGVKKLGTHPVSRTHRKSVHICSSRVCKTTGILECPGGGLELEARSEMRDGLKGGGEARSKRDGDATRGACLMKCPIFSELWAGYFTVFGQDREDFKGLPGADTRC
jgi:hypothetical protein